MYASFISGLFFVVLVGFAMLIYRDFNKYGNGGSFMGDEDECYKSVEVHDDRWPLFDDN